MELSQKYQGQVMDETKGMSIFEQEALPLAAQMGYSFTMDDLKAFGEEMKRANENRELAMKRGRLWPARIDITGACNYTNPAGVATTGVNPAAIDRAMCGAVIPSLAGSIPTRSRYSKIKGREVFAFSTLL